MHYGLFAAAGAALVSGVGARPPAPRGMTPGPGCSTPPVFADESQTHQAFMLHVVLWALVAVPLPYVVLIAIVTPEHAGRALVEASAGQAANVALLWLLRRGRVALAASLQVVAFFTFFTVLAALGEGVLSPAYTLGYGPRS